MAVIDLFAGPGGWSEGLRMLGHREVGVEWDEAACLTARAAGHERVQADVAALDPHDFLREHFAERHGFRATNARPNACERTLDQPAPALAFGHEKPVWLVGDAPGLDGLIASAPCQAWSNAGKGGGRRDIEHVIACALELAAGNDTRAEHAAKCEDERSMLVVEPLRWALALKPTWIALEQVAPVLELWILFAQLLEAHGWNAWAGVLEAERYGVPQTRERAVLMAHRDRPVHPPVATHQRYVPGEPQRHDITFDGEVLPWVSMAQALDRDGGAVSTGNFTAQAHRGQRGVKYERAVDAPSPVVTGTSARWAFKLARGEGISERHGDRPATPADAPAPTISTKARTAEWVHGRPATTVAGDPRIFPPGHKINATDVRAGRGGQRRSGAGYSTGGQAASPPRLDQPAVRVTVEEAAVLQSFRRDYPWRGSRTKQFEQVGNAVPPLLAKAVLGELLASKRS